MRKGCNLIETRDLVGLYSGLTILYDNCKTLEDVQLLDKQIENITNNPDEYGLVEFYEAVMDITDYDKISKLIRYPEKTIVVDCGCACALQQLCFNNCYKYIGIDSVLPKDCKITSNTTLIHGTIQEVLPTLEFKKDYNVIGISVMCGGYFATINETMAKYFDKLIII